MQLELSTPDINATIAALERLVSLELTSHHLAETKRVQNSHESAATKYQVLVLKFKKALAPKPKQVKDKSAKQTKPVTTLGPTVVMPTPQPDSVAEVAQLLGNSIPE